MPKFVEDTKATIECIGKWLCDNSDKLSREIAVACIDWKLTISAGDNGMFPYARLDVTKVNEDGFNAKMELMETQYGTDVTVDAIDRAWEASKIEVHDWFPVKEV